MCYGKRTIRWIANESGSFFDRFAENNFLLDLKWQEVVKRRVLTISSAWGGF